MKTHEGDSTGANGGNGGRNQIVLRTLLPAAVLNRSVPIIFGQTPSGAPFEVPTGIQDMKAISAGPDHVLALGNAQPQLQPQYALGPANQDLVMALVGSDLNADPLVFRIASLPLQGTLYQYNAGSRGAPIASPGTVVTDGGARVIFAPATNGFGNPYATFSVIANDGQVDSPAATVTVTIQDSRAMTQAPLRRGINSFTLGGMAVLSRLYC